MMELFDESHFFMCTGGMKPARIKANQKIARREDGSYYLTVYSLRCKGIDFACRMAALIGAVIAAAVALLMASGVGVVLLAAIAGAAVGAMQGAMICGDLAAILRAWVVVKNDAEINGNSLVSNRPGVHLGCKFLGNQITYVPNVKNEFTALALFAGNIICTGLEGFMYVYAARGVGLLVKSGSKFLANFATNYIASFAMKGVAMRTVFAGYSAANAHYTSPTEGYDEERVSNAAKDGGFFIERAAIRLYNGVVNDGYRNPETGETNWRGAATDVAMMLSMGGIPAAKTGDATRSDVGNMAKQVVTEWRNPVETVKAEVGKTVEVARQFRNKLKAQKDGVGAHENRLDISKYRAEPGEKLWRFAERIVEDMVRNEGYTDVFKVQNPSGNGVDIVARNPTTGDIVIIEVKSTQQGRLWDNGQMKEIPMTEAQKAGGESFSNSRLKRAAEGEDGYTDGVSSEQAIKAQEAIEAAKGNGSNVEYRKYDVYLDESGVPRAEPQQRPWEAPSE
jgi:hypothetical protein